MRTLNIPHSIQPLAVATSGGSDSMALVCALKEREPERCITALHVDHRLRKTSTEEAYQVRLWLEARGIPCVILTIDPPLYVTVGNLAAKARYARYAMMEAWCLEHNTSLLATAHHQGDQAETFLMRLARGSGVDGLACIASEGIQPSGVKLMRPMLHWRKSDAVDFLQQRDIPWIEDPTNQQSCFQRNRWRKLMPHLEAEGLTHACLARHATHMARLADYMQQQTHAWMEQHQVLGAVTYAMLPYAAWRALHPELALRVLRSSLMHLQPQHTPRFDALERLYDHLHTPHPKTTTLHGCMIRVCNGTILIHPEREISNRF